MPQVYLDDEELVEMLEERPEVVTQLLEKLTKQIKNLENDNESLFVALQKARECKTLNENQIKYMVERFLAWQLPLPWKPDGGISFEPVFNKGTQYEHRNTPSGTNLFDYNQATDMVLHMVENLPAR